MINILIFYNKKNQVECIGKLKKKEFCFMNFKDGLINILYSNLIYRKIVIYVFFVTKYLLINFDYYIIKI
jgi:hypothetical protein